MLKQKKTVHKFQQSVSAEEEVDSLVIYPNELEEQSQFHQFGDVLQSFELSQGRRSFDNLFSKKSTYAGVFKVDQHFLLMFVQNLVADGRNLIIIRF